jgi:hypothetical protein
MRFRYSTDVLNAIMLLKGAFPSQRSKLWTCAGCGRWLQALDLEKGCVVQGIFGEHVEYFEDPEFGIWGGLVSVVLKEKPIKKDRHQIKCEHCGKVNRRRRPG